MVKHVNFDTVTVLDSHGERLLDLQQKFEDRTASFKDLFDLGTTLIEIGKHVKTSSK